MWAIPDLILRALAAETPLDRTTLPGVMSRLSASIAGYPRPSVRVLPSTCIVVGVMVPRRPLV